MPQEVVDEELNQDQRGKRRRTSHMVTPDEKKSPTSRESEVDTAEIGPGDFEASTG
jgi:hypothetical protein